MTDKLIGCVQHDCDKCKERESSCNEAYRLAQLRFERIAELEAELARLKAQEPVGIVDKVGPFGFHVEFSKTLEVGTKLYLASGAAHTSKTIDVQWHHDLAPAPKPQSSFEAEAALVAQRKAFMGSR